MEYLEVWDGLRSAIQEAKSITDIRKIRDKAEAVRYTLMIAHQSQTVVRQAIEIRLRCERKAGELLLKTPKQGAGAYRKKRYQADTSCIPPSYAELGISKLDASKWMRIARIPSKEFEHWLKTESDISSAGALRLESTFRYSNRVSPPLPKGKYGVLLVDPPWKYEFAHSNFKRIEDHYPTMSLEEICAMGESIKKLSARDCTLFLWVPSPHLDKFPVVLQNWGFRFCTSWIWCKQGRNFAHYGSLDHEILIIGGKGKATPTCEPTITASISSVQSIKKSRHSAKPEEYHSLIEMLYPDRKYLELFARGDCRRKGWTFWGDEAFE